jgi:hypothetical protein
MQTSEPKSWFFSLIRNPRSNVASNIPCSTLANLSVETRPNTSHYKQCKAEAETIQAGV